MQMSGWMMSFFGIMCTFKCTAAYIKHIKSIIMIYWHIFKSKQNYNLNVEIKQHKYALPLAS